MATFLVEILTVVLIGVGVMLLRAGRKGTRRWRLRLPWENSIVCPNAECQYHNAPQARYCAHCGRQLPREE